MPSCATFLINNDSNGKLCSSEAVSMAGNGQQFPPLFLLLSQALTNLNAMLLIYLSTAEIN